MTIEVWPYRPDWDSGILERLEWLTDLMASTKGAEQRRPQRLTPRRTFEAVFLPFGRQRSVFDLKVMVKGNDDWLIPLWHDADILQEDTPAVQTALYTPYEDREFTAGGYAILRPPPSADWETTTFHYELVKVVRSKQNRLVVVRGQLGTTAVDWPQGTEIYPVRQARFVDQPNVNIVTDSVMSTTMKFVVTEANEWYGDKRYSGYGMAYGLEYGKNVDVAPRTPATNLGRVVDPWFMPEFEGFKVMNSRPDYNQDLSISYDRTINIADNQNGIPQYTDTLGFATPSQQHTWFLRGRGERAAYRTMLYYLRGRVRPVWVPTFNSDVQLIAPSLTGQNWIDIEKIEYTDVGHKSINRQALAIQFNDGSWHFARISGTANVADHERLELSVAFTRDVNPGDVYKISFMAVSRLDQDQVEINHVTDSQGLAKSVTTFRNMPDLRQYIPWAVTWPATWRACERSCASMPRIETNVCFGLPNEDWTMEDTITTAQYSAYYAALGFSHKYDPADVIAPEEQADYFQWFLNSTPGAESYIYNQQRTLNIFLLTYFNWTLYNREAQLEYLRTVLPTKFVDEVEDWDDTPLFNFYMRQQMYWYYQINLESTVYNQILHKRNWLPFKKLTEIPQSCSNNVLGRFCVQSIYTRSPVDKYPTNARGSHTVYGSGVLYNVEGLDETEWPTDLTAIGQSYCHSIMPYNGNGLHSSCGCLCLQFIEQHAGLRSPQENPDIDPEKILWWHYAQVSWLTPVAWPEQIRLKMYDSLTGYLVRTLDLEVINIPVTGYADEFTKKPWAFEGLQDPVEYSANLVVFRQTYNREANETAFHADPWDNIWNLVPLNSKGFVVEVTAR